MALTIKEAVRKWGPEYLTICGLVKYFPTMNYNSHVFFVNGIDGVGDDGVNTGGQVPDEPFLTITHALTKVTDNANDYIFILDYPSIAPATEVFPIDIWKQRTHIIGVLNGLIPRFKIVVPSTATGDDFACFRFSHFSPSGGEANSNYSEIANLLCGVKWTSSTRGAIEFNRGVWGTHIHHCGFGLALRSGTGGLHGISVGSSQASADDAGEMCYGLVENNIFGTLITESGIFVPNDGCGSNGVAGLVIRNNHFEVNSGDRGVDVEWTAANFRSGGIFNNTFLCNGDAADGEAVYFASGAQGSVHGNCAWTDDGAVPAQNPFFDADHAGTPTIGWGMNFRGPGDLATDTLCGTGAIQAPDDN